MSVIARPRCLQTYLEEQVANGVSSALVEIVGELARTSTLIASEIKKSTLAGMSELPGSVNVQGEHQKALDLIANELVIASCQKLSQVALAVSEELEEPVPCGQTGKYAVVFDPLDGSSNLDVNVTVGSIYSILEADSIEAVLKPGVSQRFAAYVTYGPATLLVLTFGSGVGFFGANEDGDWLEIKRAHSMPDSNPEYSINSSRRSEWPDGIQRFISDCDQGLNGPLQRRYNMRWVGSMVAELHRILLRGGLFLYPSKSAAHPGKLRLLYEANPMSMILEAAGGTAFDGVERILDIVPSDIHQRVGVVMGSRAEVRKVALYLDSNPDAKGMMLESPPTRSGPC